MQARRRLVLAHLAFGCIAAAPAWAQDFPNRPVHLIVGFSPGGGTDIAARQFAGHLQARLGQQVIVENRTGGGGGIAARAVAQARPDGHTLYFAGSSVTTLKLLEPATAVDVQKDLVPVGKVMESVGVLLTSTALPVKTLPEFVAHVRANPGKLAYGTAGGTLQLALDSLVRQLGLDMVQVPYKGVADIATALLGGQVQLGIDTPASHMGHREAGKVRFLAVTTPERSAAFPDVPGTREAGLGDWDYVNWNGLMAPAGTPRPVLERLAREAMAIATSDAFRAEALQWSKGSYQASWASPEQFAALIDRDTRRWVRISASGR